MDLIIASNNKHKVAEIKEILRGVFDCILSLDEAGIFSQPEEDGLTFEENSLIKARTVFNSLEPKRAQHTAVLADDSGLCVDALNGAPGVMSARYASNDSYNSTDADNRRKLLEDLKDEKNRTARFVCAMTLIGGDFEITVTGKCEGEILERGTGEAGFGYDCLFFSHDLNKPFGVASAQEKNAVSHRSKALRLLTEAINPDGINSDKPNTDL